MITSASQQQAGMRSRQWHARSSRLASLGGEGDGGTGGGGDGNGGEGGNCFEAKGLGARGCGTFDVHTRGLPDAVCCGSRNFSGFLCEFPG